MSDVGDRNIELVRGLHEAFNEVGMEAVRDAISEATDYEAAVAALGEYGQRFYEVVDPDVEVIALGFSLPDMPVGTQFRGRNGWLAFWRAWLEPWEDWWFEIGNFAAVGDQVVLDLQIRARGRVSGAPIETSASQIWTIREDRIVRLAVFDTRMEAERAAKEER